MTDTRRRLYHMPGTCALAVHVALEWVGKPYEAINLPRDQLRSPEYLAVNPMGVVPTH
jgi:glutathione S-transferase